MTGDEFKKVLNFENSLNVGDKVYAVWTNCHNYYAANATVLKVNKASFVVTLDEEVSSSLGTYPVGNKIKCPRFALGTSGMELWSANNRLEPVGGY